MLGSSISFIGQQYPCIEKSNQDHKFNSLSIKYIFLSFQLKLYGNLTTQTAITISHKLWNMFSWKEFYQKDVALGYEIILALLDFESNQVEDKLASSQDKMFLDVSLFVVYASC